jgi:hypothetical protein
MRERETSDTDLVKHILIAFAISALIAWLVWWQWLSLHWLPAVGLSILTIAGGTFIFSFVVTSFAGFGKGMSS